MRLKRVRIFGFKTFADRTEFNLDGGIVAVVGPNGCGKSNLVDAILWGLGEGNSRQLRAQLSQDVIFNGTPRRKPVGFAEVNLLFDNEDGCLPIDTAEVTVNRRLTRSGDSEYSINRQSCRLKDVYDLLADSGLGRAGYAIVGQKEIDAALSASPEDRRAWIDEAAGVQRYRSRKTESQRRLNQALDHLARVTDIITELESQREPLREEAETAIRYKSLASSLREVEIGLLVDEAAKAIREVAELEKRIAEASRLINDELARAELLETEQKATTIKISGLELEIDGIRARYQESLSAVERATAQVKLLEQRISSIDEQEVALKTDTKEIAERLVEAEADATNLEQEEEGESNALEALRVELSGVGVEAEAMRRALDDAEKELTDARKRHALKLKSDAETAHRGERKKQIERELKGIEDSLPDLEQGISTAQVGFDLLNDTAQKAKSEIESLEVQIGELHRQEEADAQAVRKSLAERASLEGRRRGIEATIEAHDGLNQGSRAVLEAAANGVLKANYIPVASAISVAKELALAIETALGGASNDLIVDDEQEAKSAIEWLKQHRVGRATFQPIHLMRPVGRSEGIKRLVGQPGVIGLANELVECAPKHRPVIDSLLGRVVIAHDIDVALKYAKTEGWSRIVTLDGEVVHSSGAVSGGHQSSKAFGLVQRRAELTDLAATLKKLDTIISQYDNRASARQSATRVASVEMESVRKRLADQKQEFDDARTFLQSLLDELRSTTRSKERLAVELVQIERADITQVEDVDVAAVEMKRDDAIRVLAGKAADAEQAESRLREAESRLSQAKARLGTARRRLDGFKENEQQRAKRLANLGPERDKLHAEITHTENQRELSQAAALDQSNCLETVATERSSLVEASRKQSESAREARSNATAIGDASHEAQLNRARAETRRANSLQRLAEEYGLTEEDAIEQEGTHEVPRDAISVVSRLRREMRGMGDVNLGAIEAFQRLSVRLDELSEQRDDVVKGIEQVEAGISELDKLTKDRFASTFEAVQIAFTEMFERLFGGGEGKLALSDPDQILESGIDLVITLPGKKRQPLALLSGGERAICASAFLFALLKVKPSPLVVLDEVDAPMDGNNVERFARTLHDFTDRSQFIVITHNPATIQSAPMWLGVSMQEPGVSMLIPTRASGNATVAQASVPAA